MHEEIRSWAISFDDVQQDVQLRCIRLDEAGSGLGDPSTPESLDQLLIHVGKATARGPEGLGGHDIE